jgi:hypothetical protein
MRRTVLPSFGLTLAMCLPVPAQATTWLCGLSEDLVRLVCVVDSDPLDDALASPGSPATTTAVVNGTRFPLDPRTVYSVDLWSPPTEVASVALLARATICYRSPGCQVVMSPLVQTRGGVAPQPLADGAWAAGRSLRPR